MEQELETISLIRRSKRARSNQDPNIQETTEEIKEEIIETSPRRSSISTSTKKRSSSSTAKSFSGKLLSELIAEGHVQGARRLLAEPGCKAATVLAWPGTCSPQSFFQSLCKWYGFVKGSQRLTFRLSSDTSDNSNITTVLLIYLNVLKSTIRWDFILFVSLFLSLLLTPISIGNFIYYIIMLMNLIMIIIIMN
jgi:hypothetical protein